MIFSETEDTSISYLVWYWYDHKTEYILLLKTHFHKRKPGHSSPVYTVHISMYVTGHNYDMHNDNSTANNFLSYPQDNYRVLQKTPDLTGENVLHWRSVFHTKSYIPEYSAVASQYNQRVEGYIIFCVITSDSSSWSIFTVWPQCIHRLTFQAVHHTNNITSALWPELILVSRQPACRWLYHKPCSWLLLLSNRPSFTFPATEYCCTIAGIKLYSLVTDTREQFDQSRHMKV